MRSSIHPIAPLFLALSLLSMPLASQTTERTSEEEQAKTLSARISLALKAFFSEDTETAAIRWRQAPAQAEELYTLLYENTDNQISEAVYFICTLPLQAYFVLSEDPRVNYLDISVMLNVAGTNEAFHSISLILCAWGYAEAAIEAGEFDEAEAALLIGLSADSTVYPDPTQSPMRLTMLYCLGTAYFNLHAYEEGSQVMLEVAELTSHQDESEEDYIDALSMAATCLALAEMWEEAIEVNTTILEVLDQQGQTQTELYEETLISQAVALRETGRLEEAEALLGKCSDRSLDVLSVQRDIYIDLNNEEGLVSLLAEAVALLERQGGEATAIREWLVCGNLTGSQPYIKRLVKLLEKALPTDDVNLLATLAYAYLQAGDLKSAAKVRRQVDERVPSLSEEELAEAEDALVMLYTAQSDFAQAAKLYERTLSTVERLQGTESEMAMEVRMIIAEMLSEDGSYAAAQEIIEDCLQASSLSEETRMQLTYELANILFPQGDFMQSYLYADYVQKNATSASQRYEGLLLSLFDLTCEADLRMTDPNEQDAKALDSLLLKLQEVGQTLVNFSNETFGSNHANTLDAQIALLGVHLICGNTSDLLTLTEACEQTIRNLELNKRQRQQYLELLAYFYLRTGDYKHGKSLIDTDCLDDASTLPLMKQQTLALLAEASALAGKQDEAQEWYRQYADLTIDQVGSHIGQLSAQARALYWGQYRQMILWGGRYADKEGQPTAFAGDIYDLCLFAKQLLTGTEAAFRRAINNTGDEDLIAQMNELFNLRTALAQGTSGTAEDYQTKADYADALEAELLKTVDLQAEEAPTWRSIQQAMPDSAICIEIMEFQDLEDTFQYGAALLRKDWITPAFVLIGTKADIEDALLETDVDDPKAQTAWQFLTPYLEGISRIYFAPAGVYHQAPVEYMPAGQADNLFQQYAVFRLTSTAQLLPQTAGQGQGAVVYGGLIYGDDTQTGDGTRLSTGGSLAYLPGTAQEATDITSLLQQTGGMDVITYTGNDGTKASVAALSGQHRHLLHIATHGFYATGSTTAMQTAITLGQTSKEDVALTHSGLVLAGGETITAQEVAALDLQGLQLVALSACDTGRGQITGDGVFGLQRGFKKAGAQALLMSLWKVQDQTAQQLITAFYRHWISGSSLRQALAQAQQELRTANPEDTDWAAFILLDANE